MKKAVVTGANRGIGLELVRGLKAQGYAVVGACRQSSDALRSAADQVIEGVDVTNGASIAEFAAAVEGPVDMLINNAGILTSEALDDLDLDRIRTQFEINAIAPLAITAAFAHKMTEGGRVGIITSRMGSIADNTSGSRYGYRMSKAAVNAAGRSLAIDLKPRGISVFILHPGFVRTDMTGKNGLLEPQESAALLIERLTTLPDSASGEFFHADGTALPW